MRACSNGSEACARSSSRPTSRPSPIRPGRVDATIRHRDRSSAVRRSRTRPRTATGRRHGRRSPLRPDHRRRTADAGNRSDVRQGGPPTREHGATPQRKHRLALARSSPTRPCSTRGDPVRERPRPDGWRCRPARGCPLGGCPPDAVATRFDWCASGAAGTGLAGRRILHVDRDANIDHCRFELEPQHDSSRCRWCRRRSRSTHVARRRAAGQEHVQPQRKRTGSISPRGRGGGALLHVAAPTLRLDPSALAASGRLGGPAWLLDNTGVVDAPAESFECDLTVANLGALVVDGGGQRRRALHEPAHEAQAALSASRPGGRRHRPWYSTGWRVDRPVLRTRRSGNRSRPRVLANLRSRHGSARGARPRPPPCRFSRVIDHGRLPVRLDHRCRPSLRLPIFLPLPGHARADAGLRPPPHHRWRFASTSVEVSEMMRLVERPQRGRGPFVAIRRIDACWTKRARQCRSTRRVPTPDSLDRRDVRHQDDVALSGLVY